MKLILSAVVCLILGIAVGVNAQGPVNCYSTRNCVGSSTIATVSSCCGDRSGSVKSYSTSNSCEVCEVGVDVGTLPNLQHGIGGTFEILSTTRIRLRNFRYDGGGPSVFLYYYLPGDPVDPRAATSRGRIIPLPVPRGDFDGSFRTGRRYFGEDLNINLPSGVTVCDISTFTIWCEVFDVFFTRLLIPRSFFVADGALPCALIGDDMPTTEAPTDFNECSANSDNCQQICTNTMGSFTCSCTSGYSLNSDGRSCSDVNECSANTDICDQQCINIQGSFTCSCSSGFTLDSDGRTCKDVDECSLGIDDCQQECTNTEASFTCSCRDGFILDEDKKTCSDVCPTCPTVKCPTLPPPTCPVVTCPSCPTMNCPTIQPPTCQVLTCPTQSCPVCPTAGSSPSTTPTPPAPTVWFELGGVVYLNNTRALLNDVGERDDALHCYSNNENCCRAQRQGEFSYPDGTRVPISRTGQNFYRNRDVQLIRLNRRNGASVPTGVYCCEVPDASGVTQKIFITLE